MKRTLIASALLLMTGASFAGDEKCKLNIDYGIKLHSDKVELTAPDGEKLLLSNGSVSVDGKTLAVNDKEKQLLRDYETHSRKVVPQVYAITTDALAIAADASTLAIGALLGKDDPALKKLQSRFAELNKEISTRITPTSLPVTDAGWEGFDAAVEEAAEDIAESVTSATFASMGNVMRLVFDEDYREDFEARMKKMETEMDERIEKRAEAMEPRARELCDTFRALDSIETTLVATRPELKALNMVQPSEGKGKKFVTK